MEKKEFDEIKDVKEDIDRIKEHSKNAMTEFTWVGCMLLKLVNGEISPAQISRSEARDHWYDLHRALNIIQGSVDIASKNIDDVYKKHEHDFDEQGNS